MRVVKKRFYEFCCGYGDHSVYISPSAVFIKAAEFLILKYHHHEKFL